MGGGGREVEMTENPRRSADAHLYLIYKDDNNKTVNQLTAGNKNKNRFGAVSILVTWTGDLLTPKQLMNGSLEDTVFRVRDTHTHTHTEKEEENNHWLKRKYGKMMAGKIRIVGVNHETGLICIHDYLRAVFVVPDGGGGRMRDLLPPGAGRWQPQPQQPINRPLIRVILNMAGNQRPNWLMNNWRGMQQSFPGGGGLGEGGAGGGRRRKEEEGGGRGRKEEEGGLWLWDGFYLLPQRVCVPSINRWLDKLLSHWIIRSVDKNEENHSNGKPNTFIDCRLASRSRH